MTTKDVNGYQLNEKLGQGASAVVYRATHPKHKSPVVVKLFHAHLAQDPQFQEQLSTQLKREVMALNRLDHPGIAKLVDFDALSDQAFVVYEDFEGESLEDFQNRLPYILPEISVLFGIQILDALAHAHQQGIVHRDIKPSNILIGKKDYRILLTDFGLAKMTHQASMTTTGSVMGSPEFMSPEQAKGAVATAQSDLFSAAAVMYFLMSGTRPFSRNSPLATLSAVAKAETESLSQRNPKVSRALSSIIHRGLALESEERYQSAAEFSRALKDYLNTLGLDREDFSLAAWAKSGHHFITQTMTQMSEDLTLRCEELIQKGDSGRAWVVVSHLGLIAPENPAIEKLMASIQRTQKASASGFFSRRVALIVLLLVGSLAGAGVFYYQKQKAGSEIAQPHDPLPRMELPQPPVEPSGPNTAVVVTPPPKTERPQSSKPEVSPPASALSAPVAAPAVVTPKPAPGKPQKLRPTANSRVAAMVPVLTMAKSRKKPRKKPQNETTGEINTYLAKIKFDLGPEVDAVWDGRKVSKNETIEQIPGEYELVLKKKGYAPIIRKIHVTLDEPTVIRVR